MTPIPEAAKAWIALAGATATALLGVFAADSDIGKVLVVVAVLATAWVTFQVPNAQPTTKAVPDEGGYTHVELILLLLGIAGLVIIILAVTGNLR